MEAIDKISNKIFNKISKYSKKNKNEEICGILIEENGDTEFVECENLAEDKKFYFKIDHRVFIYYNIQMIVHSHCVGGARPSAYDKQCSDLMDIPFLIYSVLFNNFCLYYNKSVTEFKV